MAFMVSLGDAMECDASRGLINIGTPIFSAWLSPEGKAMLGGAND
jgi:hypothetical protein